MKKPSISITVSMDDKVFSSFSSFDVFIMAGRGRMLLGFFVLMTTLALINFYTDAALLFWILIIIGGFVPLSFLVRYRASTVQQINRFHLEEPKDVYCLDFFEEDKSFALTITDQPTQRIAYSSMHGAYRTKRAIYLYVKKTQAYIVPVAQLGEERAKALWALLEKKLPADKLYAKPTILRA